MHKYINKQDYAVHTTGVLYIRFANWRVTRAGDTIPVYIDKRILYEFAPVFGRLRRPGSVVIFVFYSPDVFASEYCERLGMSAVVTNTK